MSGAFTQDKRIGALKTDLGDDKLVLTRFDGSEGMSELFEFHVEAIHQDRKVDFNPILGKTCTVSLVTLAHGKRYFAGTLTEVRYKGETQEGFVHELVLRPWLWLLSKRTNSRIFHDLNALDIIKKIFGDHGFADFKDRTSKDHPVLEYCVQHSESDMNFVCRLMEAHGISYRFAFGDGTQTLILGDDGAAYDDIPGSTRNFYGDAKYLARDEEHFYTWSPGRHFTTGKVTLRDYDLLNPGANLIAEVNPVPAVQFSPDSLEDYTHPYHQQLASKMTQAEGRKYAEARIAMHRAEDVLFYGNGDAMTAAPGLKVTLAKTPEGSFDEEYLLLRCIHSFGRQSYRSGGRDAPPVYQVSVTAMPSSIPYAPPMSTEKPFIAGPQTAKVVSRQPGLEIDCDELGRVFVHFHWDRASESEAVGRSMPCRVAQVWAGAKWGGIFIPRVGMEVLVHFIDGDPDRPIIIGTVYNGKDGKNNAPPFDLPSKKNIAGWKSKSTPDGGSGYNEFTMDDTTGSEVITVHGQKDLKTKIEHDETREVLNDRTTDIGKKTSAGNDKLTVGINRTTDIGVNDKLDVGAELSITAKAKVTITVGGSSIEMTPASITIKTLSLETNGTATATHQAGGVMTIKGATVLIN